LFFENAINLEQIVDFRECKKLIKSSAQDEFGDFSKGLEKRQIEQFQLIRRIALILRFKFALMLISSTKAYILTSDLGGPVSVAFVVIEFRDYNDGTNVG
jgi:hypothetical protein